MQPSFLHEQQSSSNGVSKMDDDHRDVAVVVVVSGQQVAKTDGGPDLGTKIMFPRYTKEGTSNSANFVKT
jgi:hypothetical protein